MTPRDLDLQALEDVEEPAILLSPEYKILATNRAYEAHYGAVVRVGQDHCYSVSHGYESPCDKNGEQCPLAEARASRRPARVFHIHHGPEGPEYVDVSLTPLLGADGQPRAYLERIRVLDAASARIEGSFVGRSQPFKHMVELLHRVAPTDLPVTLLGESGTGKELAASALHQQSARRDGPFVPLECSGLTESLFESELFGHRRGAFTGATEDKVGLVTAAAGGTLFLDEIGDVPLSMQVKLLRVLESGRYRRVGDVSHQSADFRLVCATHRDLPRMVQEGRFRADLYYRINAFPITIPPLRTRPEDVPLLAGALLRTAGTSKRLSAAATQALVGYSFPGNVRELRNILDRAIVLADGEVLQAEHLQGVLRGAPPSPRLGHDDAEQRHWPWGQQVLPLAEVEARYLAWAAEHHEGDRRTLALKLGLSERTLYRRLERAKAPGPMAK